MNKLSLRFRLTFSILTVVFLTWSGGLLAAYKALDVRMQRPVIHALQGNAEIARMIIRSHYASGEDITAILSPGADVGNELERVFTTELSLGIQNEPSFIYAVWRGGELLFSTLADPSFDAPENHGARGVRDPYRDANEPWYNDNTYWYLYDIHDPVLDIWLTVGRDTGPDQRMVRFLLWMTLLPLGIILAASMLLLYFLVAVALRPLTALASALSEREPDQLDPVVLADTPREIEPILTSLNRLFLRLKKAHAYEREFMQNAAHELRTPLAAIKAQLHNVQVSAASEKAADEIATLDLALDRASRVVGQLLGYARADALDLQAEQTPLKLRDMLEQQVRDHLAPAAEKSVSITFSNQEDLIIVGDRVHVETIMRNLIDNAVKYTPNAGTISIDLDKQKRAVSIKNTCAPISADHIKLLTNRFYRHLGAGEEGAGLGLSIVEKLGKRHGAGLHLNWRAGYFIATVTFADDG